MWHLWIPLGLIALLGSSPNWEIAAFNVETKHYALYKSTPESLFGFSVAGYRDANGYGSVIIGAPAAETYERNIRRSGSVFKCPTDRDNSCSVIPFDTSSANNYVNTTGGFVQIDEKSGQWFGATLSSSKVDGGPLLACAPKYLWFGKHVTLGPPPPDQEKREPVGTCWLTDFVDQSLEFSPCRTGKQGYNYQGTCQAGLGAALAKDGKRVFVGAPGSWYWQGQLYSIDSQVKFAFCPDDTQLVSSSEGQVYSMNLMKNRTYVLMTKEGVPENDNSYMGYSVTSGDFQRNSKNDVAVGIPRGNNLKGQVAIFDWNMRNYRNITGEQMGAYFGYALASGDINGDGVDDLIIGAPMFTLRGNLEIIETGRIYIAYQAMKSGRVFDKKDYRDGEFNRGRFGLSVAFLGDIDHDRYGDIAVGAPYGGPEGRGAVYIYRGSEDGLREKYSQVIFSTDLQEPLRTFGFSIAGGLDLDGNTYADLVVGAYESDAAVFLRSRPVVRADCHVKFMLDNYRASGINLDNKNCKVNGISEKVACLELKIFFTFDGEYSNQIFDVEIILDAAKIKNPRLFFSTDVHSSTTTIENVSVERKVEWSRAVKVYVSPHIRDKLSGIEAEARLTLSEDRRQDRGRHPNMPLKPVLAETKSFKDTIYIRKNCGPDNICIPDLQLYVNSSVSEYLIGSGQEFNLIITVKNMGEDAYEAMFYLELPSHMEYINTEQLVDTGVLVQCFPPEAKKRLLRCDIGNPMPQGKMVKFKIRLQPKVADNMNPTFDFKMEVNTTNSENPRTVNDNYKNIQIPLWVDLELVVEGESRPKELFYNPDNYTSENITTDVEFGPVIVHNYTIRNNGPSNFLLAEVNVTWPGKTLGGDDLLYLMDEPQGQDKIICSNANYNYQHLAYSDKLNSRYYAQYTDFSNQKNYIKQSSRGIGVQTGYETSESVRREEVNIGDSSDFNQQRNSHTSSYQDQLGTKIHNEEERKVIVTSDGSSGGYGVSSASFGGDFHTTTQPGRNYLNDSANSREYFTRRRQQKILEEEQKRIRQQEKLDQEEYDRRTVVPVYGTEHHYGEDREERHRNQGSYGVLTHSHFDDKISGDREEVVGTSDIDVRIRNITTKQDLEEFFSKISGGGYKVTVDESIPGKKFIRFRGKYSTMEDGRKCIVLPGSSMQFPLQNSIGQDIFSDDRASSRRFNLMDGELIAGPGNRAFIELPNGYRFAIEGFATYTTRTYSYTKPQETDSSSFTTHSKNPYGNGEAVYGHSSGHSSGSSSGSNIEGNYEIHSSRSHEERHTNERRVQSRVYSRTSDLPINENLADPKYDPQGRNSRHRRESDVINVEDFKNIETRSRRQVDLQNLGPNGKLDQNNLKLTESPCKSADCFQIQCILHGLAKGEEAHLSLKFRIKAATLKKVAFREPVQVSTQVKTRITRFASVDKLIDQKINTEEVFTNVEPTAPPPVADVVPLWVVVLSACAGVIILLLLILLLHKFGFFKRNRPNNVPERQPLNRNGHYIGDD